MTRGRSGSLHHIRVTFSFTTPRRFDRRTRRKNTKSAVNQPTHVTHENVLDDLGFSPEQATALKFKAELYQAILKAARKYSQKELQLILGEPQPRVSELLNGTIADKSVDKPFCCAGRLGIAAKAKFTQARKEVTERELSLAG